MQIKQIELQEAMSLAPTYDFVIGNTISNVIAGAPEKLGSGDWDDFLDVRFFSSNGELHIYRDGELKAIQFTEEDNDEYHDRTLQIDKTIKACSEYSRMVVREYYQFDDDGQLEISYTRPVTMS